MRIERIALRALDALEPETARYLVAAALKSGLFPVPRPFGSERLGVDLAGLSLPNPLGLAAGFDKDAEMLRPLAGFGFGFIEAGAVTPLPQPGNEKPRLFRLGEDRAVINRFGFNSRGTASMRGRLAVRPREMTTGLNIGANKDSTDPSADYAATIAACGQYVDFVTVNISSPNTPGLRRLANQSALRPLLESAADACRILSNQPKLFLKMSPDLCRGDVCRIAATAMESGVDAIIASNTIAVNFAGGASGASLGLRSSHAIQQGGLSGRPLFEPATRMLGEIYHVTEGGMPLIGVGGIESAAHAITKIEAGATALQLYTSLVFSGFSLISTILRGLDEWLRDRGCSSVSEMVGSDSGKWRMPAS